MPRARIGKKALTIFPGRMVEEPAVLRRQQRLDFPPPQFLIAAARFGKEGGARRRFALERGVIQLFDLPPAVGIHGQVARACLIMLL